MKHSLLKKLLLIQMFIDSMTQEEKTYKLKDLVELKNGYAFKGADFVSDGVPVIKIKNVKPGKISLNDLSYVSREIADKARGFRIEPKDILITMSGNRIDGTPDTWVGKVSVFKKEDEYLLNQRVGILRVKDYSIVSEEFLGQMLSSKDFQKYFILNATSSGGQANISPDLIYNTEVTLPAIEKQKSIASILSSLDDKIELNLQMNQTLESIAQAIFHERFGKYKPGDELPEGWRWGKVRDISAVNINTLRANDELDEIQYIEISEVEKGVIKSISFYKRGEEPSRAKRKLSHGDVVISTVRPNRGSYFLSIHPEDNLIASTGFAVFTATSVPFTYLYCLLTNEEQIEYYGRMADGAAYPAINPSLIMDINVVIPSPHDLEKFKNLVELLLLMLHENLNQNKTLTQIRDSLLPRLVTEKMFITY